MNIPRSIKGEKHVSGILDPKGQHTQMQEW